ncbi:septin domain-containing protein [Hirsutella rhossiliensis]|uniref:Septin domain-containing protein n=1 Tax=Hirsutella rhossiliensis TaxID=111463 RepID=A0A9P8SIF5_9HYPO|nr:septin domain-containing protein [Hirsutella rhossiliensis]KAH0964158.1 septin domain-containing protein [Hirsutella rhossiliensis]
MTSPPPRRPSFGMLLRRSKSGDFGKNGKKAQAIRDAELDRQRQNPPRLPEFRNNTSDQLSKSFAPDLQSSPSYSLSSGPPARPSRDAPRTTHYPPVPPIPFDPYARTESMTHRGRYSYASSAVSTVAGPRRIRRRKDPTPFNVLVVGTRSAGKTSFLEFLKTALALPAHKRSTKRADEDDFKFPTPATGNFAPHYLETETDGERVGLTLWDSEGLEKNVVDLQLREITAFLESKFEETFGEEMKVIRSPGVQDTHIHAVLLILDPARLDRNIAAAKKLSSNGYHNGASPANGLQALGSLDDDLDLQVLRTLYGKTTVIPVIAKADTITTKHMNVLKKAVWDCIRKANLDPLEALGLDDDSDGESYRIDEDDENQADEDRQANKDGQEPSSPPPSTPSSNRQLSPSMGRPKAQESAKEEEKPFLPFSIISPDLYEPGVIGRRFPWGFADPYNEQHCDFQRLKEAIFTEWRGDLREASRDQWYEGWRTNRLKQGNLPYRPR